MWENFHFNAPYEGEDIIGINGVTLPKSYLDFMKEHNGGEGDIGETWLELYRLEELQEINDEDYIREYLSNGIIIGSNGSEELYGIDANGMFFNVPSLIEEEYLTILCDDMSVFAEKVNDFWKSF